MELQTEFTGGPTPEQVKLELTFKELTGKMNKIVSERLQYTAVVVLIPEK